MCVPGLKGRFLIPAGDERCEHRVLFACAAVMAVLRWFISYVSAFRDRFASGFASMDDDSDMAFRRTNAEA